MLEYKGKVDIKIDLPNGIYYFKEESGTGKSRLAKLLTSYHMAGMPVVSYTYKDKVYKTPFTEIVKPGKQELLLLDRYDLYNGEFKEQIEEFAKTGVVLIDIKGGTTIKCNPCYIIMEKETIEVTDNEDALYI